MKCGCNNGKIIASVNYGERDGECHSEIKEIECPDCGGTGEISKEKQEWKKRGLELREWRNHLMLSYSEVKTYLCLPSLSSFSQAENGRVDPGYIISKIKQKGLGLSSSKEKRSENR